MNRSGNLLAIVCCAMALAIAGCGKTDQITNNSGGGGQWTAISSLGSYVYGTYVYTVTASGANLLAAIQYSDSDGVDAYDRIYRSSDKGATWTLAKDNVKVNTFAVSGSTVFAGSDSGLYLSLNSGSSWTAAGLHDTGITALAVNGSTLFAGTRFGVSRSSDNGATWTEVNGSLSGVTTLAVNGSALFAGYKNSYAGGIFRSSDGGASWAAVDSGAQTVNAFAVNGSVLFAGTYQGILRSLDNGVSWSMTPLSIQTFDLTVSGDVIFAATMSGVFKSTDNGATWTAAGDGLGYTQYRFVIVNNGYLFAVESQFGVESFRCFNPIIWRLPLSGL
jgi:hypothetical protein